MSDMPANASKGRTAARRLEGMRQRTDRRKLSLKRSELSASSSLPARERATEGRPERPPRPASDSQGRRHSNIPAEGGFAGFAGPRRDGSAFSGIEMTGIHPHGSPVRPPKADGAQSGHAHESQQRRRVAFRGGHGAQRQPARRQAEVGNPRYILHLLKGLPILFFRLSLLLALRLFDPFSVNSAAVILPELSASRSLLCSAIMRARGVFCRGVARKQPC